MRSRVVAIGLLAAVALAACDVVVGPNSLVDGWSIGEATPCAVADARCVKMVEVATEQLASRDSGHALILTATLHAEGLYPGDNGQLAPIWRSGGFPSVVLFQLADGSLRAIGVKYVLNDDTPTAFDRGPERRPG